MPHRRWWGEWTLLADDLWQVMHDDRSGRPRVDPRRAGIGLGAALVLELLFSSRATLEHGCVVPDPTVKLMVTEPARFDEEQLRSAMPDRPGEQLLRMIVAEPQPVPIEDWVAYLAEQAPAMVAQRMVTAGLLKPAPPRRLPFARRVYEAQAPNAAAWAAVRLQQPLRGGALDEHGIIVLGLCRAIGLDRWVFAVQREAAQPALQKLLALPDALPPPFPLVWQRLDALVTALASRLR